MYKMSEVVYRLANGAEVKTYKDAVESGQRFTVEYRPIYEETEFDEKVLARRRSLY